MPKPSEDVQDLKRRLVLLDRLGGRALVCAEGTHVLQAARVRDAGALVAACREGRPALAAVRAGLALREDPLPVTAPVLAAARRDLRVLAMPHAAALVREAPRVFRRYGGLDAAWLAAKEADLARLADAPRQAAAVDAWTGGLPPWFERVLEIVALVHGEDAAAVARNAAWELAGPEGTALKKPRSSPGGIRAVRDAALAFAAHGALWFDPRPREGGELRLAREEVTLGIDGLRSLEKTLGDKAVLRLREALVLGRLGLAGDDKVAMLVAGGLPIASVERAAELGRKGELSKVRGGAEAARAYVEWLSVLVPHYRSLGLELPISPELFERLPTAKKSDLAVLAVCLMKHHTNAAADTAEQALARLDATLALFARRPADVASILGELTGTTPGAGRAAMPEIAAWLGDDALLDRHVHLCRIAGVPPALSRALRADFERGASLARERDHLAALPSRTPLQEERLARLRDGALAAGPERTRRRLAERARELLAMAYEARLDAVLRRIAKEAWGISVPRLTPAWRDAVRFYLSVQKNRALLATVLRTAASGADLARALPKNQAWIASVAGKFDVDAWLAPRSRDVEIGGKKHTLSVELDPIEVMRMGIPFDTCLSLVHGMNAASTVVNAADANKRVLYLRDAGGSIVARKLIAVSRDHRLIGYRVYVAAHDHRREIEAAFSDMCARIAEAARLPLAPHGKPKQIHPGFWYDDGTRPFDMAAPDAPVAEYCQSLGVPAPSVADEDLAAEARAFAAVERADVDEACASLVEGGGSWAHQRAAAWVLPRLDRARLAATARRSSALAEEAIRRAGEAGLPAMLRAAGQLADWRLVEMVVTALQAAPGDAGAALALVDAASAHLRAHPKIDSDELPHRTFDVLPALLRRLPVRDALAVCDRAEPLWKAIGERREECVECADEARRQAVEAIVAAYAGARDPGAVIERLGGRSGLLARRAALAVAARYALHPRAMEPTLPAPRMEPLRACPEAVRALVKLRRREPSLEREPALLAAWIRQAGGVPRGVALPAPDDTPFPALGDLLAQLDLAEVVAPWCGRDVDPAAAWREPWERYFHRRVATGLRARLADEARALVEAGPGSGAGAAKAGAGSAADPSGGSDAFDPLARLAQLGDVAAFDSWMRAVSGHGAGAARMRARLERQRAVAREMAGQVASSGAEDPLAAELLRRARGRPKLLAEGVDFGLVLAAVARIERHVFGLPGATDEDGALALAYQLVAEVDWTRLLRAEIVTALVERRAGRFSGEDRAFVTSWLESLTGWNAAVLPPAVLLGLVADRDLRPRVISLLGKDGVADAERACKVLEALARNTGREQALEGFFDELCAAFAEGGTNLVTGFQDQGYFRRAVRILIGQGIAARLVAGYRTLADHGEMVAFLQELAASPLRDSEAMRAAVRVAREDRTITRAVALEWLEACLAGAVPAPAPSSRRGLSTAPPSRRSSAPASRRSIAPASRRSIVPASRRRKGHSLAGVEEA